MAARVTARPRARRPRDRRRSGRGTRPRRGASRPATPSSCSGVSTVSSERPESMMRCRSSLVDRLRARVAPLRDLRERGLEPRAQIVGQRLPERRVHGDVVADVAVIALGHVRLHLVELRRVDVRPGVLLRVDGARLQRLIDLAECHLLRAAADRLDLGLQDVRFHDAELESACVVGLDQRPRARELLHAVVPELQGPRCRCPSVSSAARAPAGLA